MKQSKAVEPQSGLSSPAETAAQSLEALCVSLTRLEHGEVQRWSEDLHRQVIDLRGVSGGLSPAEVDRIRSGLKLARTLVANASRLYGGWAQVAALDAPYTPDGTAALVPARSVIAQG